jgi:hypothetical protein
MRMFVIGLLCCGVIGCRSGYNPFWPGPSQVPPPPTGSASPSDPYYAPRGASGVLGSRDPAEKSYSARLPKPRQSRFTSDSQSQRDHEEPTRIDESLSRAVPATDSSSNDRLNWRSPAADRVVTSSYEASRPRPRFPR